MLVPSPVLRLLGNIHREVAERDLHVEDARHGVGHQEVPRPRPSPLSGRTRRRPSHGVGGSRQGPGKIAFNTPGMGDYIKVNTRYKSYGSERRTVFWSAAVESKNSVPGYILAPGINSRNHQGLIRAPNPGLNKGLLYMQQAARPCPPAGGCRGRRSSRKILRRRPARALCFSPSS